ncbi:MAG: DUF3526 domain-containing protein [Balneola sp.]|nr:MAG: DUF3526 domain-containing protein [Balneola sp.]
MLIQNIIHEIRLLSRSYWFLALSLIFILLCLYAGYNGMTHHEFRTVELDQAKAEQQELIDNVFSVAQAVQNGESPDNAYRLSPMNASISTGALAYMAPEPLNMFAIGQSDLYTHQIKISAREDIATLTFTEMSNPVQLLFGNFDLVFVFTYLIPLIIIAFTYNLQSQELESGRLKLLASSPINPKIWLFQRYLTRFLSICFILGVINILLLLVLNADPDARLTSMALATFAYLCFWFAVSFLVNVFGTTSGQNAVVLLSIWIVLVLIIPATVNQQANSIYPTPSRVLLLNEIRETKKELSEEQDKVLAEYLRNHPELARNEGENRFAYWQGFFASQEMMEQSLSPLIEQFDTQLAKQSSWVNTWRFLSPAILFQSSFTELAGTSSRQYNEFKAGVKDFSISWREFFMPMVFENRMLTISDLELLPSFEHQVTVDRRFTSTNLIALMAISGLLLAIGFRKQQMLFQL